MDLFSFDRSFYDRGHSSVAGIDEAGRGPWAGPVVASSVILPKDVHIPGLNDSKKLSPKKRENMFQEIKNKAVCIGIEVIGPDIIDELNILQATYAAMKGSLGKLSKTFDLVLVDGWAIPELGHKQLALVGGDGKSAAIAAASVVAKVTRDRIMLEFSKIYPEYKFELHKGYGTAEHQKALRSYGPCPIHRKTFAPIKKYFTA